MPPILPSTVSLDLNPVPAGRDSAERVNPQVTQKRTRPYEQVRVGNTAVADTLQTERQLPSQEHHDYLQPLGRIPARSDPLARNQSPMVQLAPSMYDMQSLEKCLAEKTWIVPDDQAMRAALDCLAFAGDAEKGNTVLTFAAQKNQSHIVAALLRNGANPAEVRADGFSPLQVAIGTGRIETVRVFLGHPKAAEAINAVDAFGRTALMFAIQMGDRCEPEMVRLLVEAPGSSDATHAADRQGFTPLMYAVQSKSRFRFEFVRLLVGALKPGALNAVSPSGSTALMYAVSAQTGDRLEMVRLLVNALDPEGINAVNSKGRTALMHAILTAGTDQLEIVKFLITAFKTPAALNVVDNSGFTAPMYAAAEGNYQATLLLTYALNTHPEYLHVSAVENTPLDWSLANNLPVDSETIFLNAMETNDRSLSNPLVVHPKTIGIAVQAGHLGVLNTWLSIGVDVNDAQVKEAAIVMRQRRPEFQHLSDEEWLSVLHTNYPLIASQLNSAPIPSRLPSE